MCNSDLLKNSIYNKMMYKIFLFIFIKMKNYMKNILLGWKDIFIDI